MSIQKFVEQSMNKEVDTQGKTEEIVLIEFFQHPGFELFYKVILEKAINKYTNHLLNEDYNDDKTISLNKANRMIRNILLDLYNEPLNKAKELGVIELNN